MEKENLGGNRLTEVHLEKWPLKRSVCVIQDLYCVEWDVKLYYTIPYHTIQTEKPDAED